MLEAKGVRKRFGGTSALAGVDFRVEAGEVRALLGENGAGKSTLMKILAGAIPADTGEIRLSGESYRPMSPGDACAAGVRMIYQELSLAPHLTVAENILLGAEPARGGILRRSEMKQRARAALLELGHGEISTDTPVGRLPAAARQIVEIARAVALGCRVLIFDEPTSSLGREDVERLFSLIRKLKSRGTAIVYISHFLDEVGEIADTFTVLRDGATVTSGSVAATTPADWVAAMVGKRLEDLYPRSERKRGEALLSLNGLSSTPESGARVREASLALHRGEVFGIAGLVGAGRTELLRAIFGLERVRSGQVQVKAHLGDATPARRWAEGVGLVSEDRKAEGLSLAQSIAENLTAPKLPGVVSPARQSSAAREWIERLQIRCAGPEQPVGRLSGGNQQKVAIARLLHADCDVLLLDEPTRGIDVGSKNQIYRLVDALALQGKAVLIVSSYIPELLGVCDRVAVMNRGVLGKARCVSDWSEESILAEAFGTATKTDTLEIEPSPRIAIVANAPEETRKLQYESDPSH